MNILNLFEIWFIGNIETDDETYNIEFIDWIKYN